LRFIELLQGGEERQLAGQECLLQIGQEQAAEETRQDADRKEEAWPAGDPACAIRQDATTGADEVNMRVEQQILTPGVKYAEEADLCPQVCGIRSDRAQGLGRGTEKGVVDL
jgi:hypothetical protein